MMVNLTPLVVACYDVRPEKGGRRFEGFRPGVSVKSVCEHLFGHVATAGFGAKAIAEMFVIREIDVPKLMEENGFSELGARKLRFLSTPTAWTPLQVNWLMMLWHCHLTTSLIAVRLGRSAGSVRYKARSLGLPSRPRQSLVRKAPDLLPPLAPLQYRSWNDTDELRFGQEHLQGVSTHATARRLRRDHRHTQWTMCRLGLPGRSVYRNQLTRTVYDPDAPMLEKFRKAGWKFRKCIATGTYFWGPDGARICAEFKRTKAYRDMVASGVLAYD
ncbi:MAG: hypothetical protein EOO77_17135 [Oxalobacteraceae bacterium]|nr:MAG: hypothetical protein EOO77_17135 [Oxalobacteraceae bacterium]